MPVLIDLFGTVVPAQLNTPVQVTLATEDDSQTAPAIITLRGDENAGYLVADYLCLSGGDSDPWKCAKMFEDAFNAHQNMTIQFHPSSSAPRLSTVVVSHSGLIAAALEGSIRGKLMVTQQEVKTHSDQLDSVKLCIPNFPPFTGRGASTTVETAYSHSPQRRSFHRMGYVELEADDWRITIAQRTEPSALEYSHDVLVTKEGGKQFSADELSELLGTLSHYLTFIAGVPRWPIISVGYQNGCPTWGQFNFVQQRTYVQDNWFNPMEGESIAALFPLFWQRHSAHGSAMDREIALYAESSMISHIGLFKHALPISQSALEDIAESEIGKRRCGNTDQHIERALTNMGISTHLSDFPDVLGLWNNLKQSSDGDEGPTFITRLRNTIHPKPAAAQYDSRDYYQAWKLSQYYVETALLKLCNYTGKRRNRMTAEWTTDSEQVPWAVQQEDAVQE